MLLIVTDTYLKAPSDFTGEVSHFSPARISKLPLLFFFPLGVRSKHVDTEVSIMRKLIHHKNILQLLDWNTTDGESFLHTILFLNFLKITKEGS